VMVRVGVVPEIRKSGAFVLMVAKRWTTLGEQVMPSGSDTAARSRSPSRKRLRRRALRHDPCPAHRTVISTFTISMPKNSRSRSGGRIQDGAEKLHLAA
jgi:hypothetical protein